MVPVSPRFDPPGPPLSTWLFLAGLWTLLLALVVLAEAGAWLLSAALADLIPRAWLQADHMGSALLVDASLLLHLLCVPTLVMLGSGRLRAGLESALVRLRRHRLLRFLARHRARLPAYFEGAEVPELACALAAPDAPARGDHPLGDFLLLLVLQAIILDLAGAMALAQYPVSGPVYATRAILGLSLLGLVTPLFPVGQPRRWVLATLPSLAIAAILVLDPRLIAWNHGLALAALALPLGALALRAPPAAGSPAAVLFATDRGVRLVEFKGERMREGELPAFRPERLTLTAHPDGPRWELSTSGLAPLALVPVDGDPAELARTRALHGAPLRLVHEPDTTSRKGLLVTDPVPTLALPAVLLVLGVLQWFPILQSGTALALSVAPLAQAASEGGPPPADLLGACRAYLAAYPENESVRQLLVLTLERSGDRAAALAELKALDGLAERLPNGIEWDVQGPMGRARIETLLAQLGGPAGPGHPD